jgi:hypothetical protein
MQQYGTVVPFSDMPDVGLRIDSHIHNLLSRQMESVMNDQIFKYCNSSIWNRRIWDYLMDTAQVTYASSNPR